MRDMAARAVVTDTRPTDTRPVTRLIAALNSEGASGSVLARYSRSDALARKLKEYGAPYPRLRVHPLDMFSEADLVVVRFLLDLEGRLAAVDSGTELPPEVLEAIAVCRVEDEMINDVWLEMDVFGHVVSAGEGLGAAGSLDRSAETEASRSVVLRYLAALNNQPKTPELIERFASDPALVGHILAFEAGFPEYNLLADDVIASGDRVAVRFHTRQRHANEFMGIPATGRDVSITGIIIYRVADGKIVEHWLQADTWALMLALQAGSPVATKQQFIERRVKGERRNGAGQD